MCGMVIYPSSFMEKKLCDQILFVHIVDTQLKFCDMYVNGYCNWPILYTMVPLEVQ